MGIPSEPSGRGFIRDSHAVLCSWIYVRCAVNRGMEMTREQYKKASHIINHIGSVDKDISHLKEIADGAYGLYVAHDGYYKHVPADEERVKQFLAIVLQDLMTEKAKLEKELEDL